MVRIETFEQYLNEARKTAQWGFDQDPVLYCAIGLFGEAGEVANKLKKTKITGMRGDVELSDIRDELIGEIGDVLWYAAMLANQLGISFEDVATRNIEKLADRANRGVIKGNRDKR